MKKLLYITNIPTPYRNFRFSKMASVFRDAGIQVEVLFMNAAEPDRNWPLETENMHYQYRIFSHRKVVQRLGMWMHFSPGLLLHLLREKYDIAVLGGLASPAHFLASLLLNKRGLNVLSVESNLASIGNQGGLATRVKQYLMRRFRAFQVTGSRSVDFIRHYVPALDEGNIAVLPNIINEPLFDKAGSGGLSGDLTSLLKTLKASSKRIGLIPARLIEAKGLIPFFSALDPNTSLTFIVAGEGELRDALQELVKQRDLDVHFVGSQSPEQVACLMKSVDFLALPSKSDPSPLSVIEALYCGLPLLISNNLGNADEVLEDSVNGVRFTYGDADATRQAAEVIATADSTAFTEMGNASKARFVQHFASDTVLQHYLQQLQAMMVR